MTISKSKTKSFILMKIWGLLHLHYNNVGKRKTGFRKLTNLTFNFKIKIKGFFKEMKIHTLLLKHVFCLCIAGIFFSKDKPNIRLREITAIETSAKKWRLLEFLQHYVRLYTYFSFRDLSWGLSWFLIKLRHFLIQLVTLDKEKTKDGRKSS